MNLNPVGKPNVKSLGLNVAFNLKEKVLMEAQQLSPPFVRQANRHSDRGSTWESLALTIERATTIRERTTQKEVI